MTAYKESFVVLLKGLKESDLEYMNFADIKYEETKSEESPELSLEIEYIKLPKKFTTLAKWPKSTNLLCWNCDRAFLSIPVFVPSNVCEKSMDTEGCFCTFNCAQSYIDKEYKEQSRCDRMRFLLNLYEIFTDKRVFVIKPSPPKTLMSRYCGENGISEAKYGELIQETAMEYSLHKWKADHFSILNQL